VPNSARDPTDKYGIMEWWNNEMLECWNNGIMGKGLSGEQKREWGRL